MLRVAVKGGDEAPAHTHARTLTHTLTYTLTLAGLASETNKANTGVSATSRRTSDSLQLSTPDAVKEGMFEVRLVRTFAHAGMRETERALVFCLVFEHCWLLLVHYSGNSTDLKMSPSEQLWSRIC